MHRNALLKQILHVEGGGLQGIKDENEDFIKRKRQKKEEERRAEEAKKSLLEKHNELTENINGISTFFLLISFLIFLFH